MSDNPTVKIVNNAYKLDGEFHKGAPNSPIRNEDGKLCGVTNPRQITHIHTYGGEAPFFDGVAHGKLLGTRCDNDDCEFKGTVHLPYRIHCPDCLKKMTEVDLTDAAQKTAKIYSYIETSRTGAFNTLDKPIKFIDIEIDGVSTMLKSYMTAGSPGIGVKVIPIFKTTDPTYTITDLAWVADGTKENELPKDYSF